MPTDGFGLLLEAYSQQTAAAGPPYTSTCPTPTLAQEPLQATSNAALYMAPMQQSQDAASGLLPEQYFSPSGSFMPQEDGYADELQFFVGGNSANAFPDWSLPGGPMMYTTY